MFVGSHVDKLVKQIGAKDIVVRDFQTQAAAAYLTCGQYMQKKTSAGQCCVNSPGISGSRIAWTFCGCQKIIFG